MTPKSPPDISVHDIANWFLAKAQSENKSLKHMKLQKLVYFAYGWYFAYFDRPLFEEEIYAWRHGPVVENLYHRYKFYGKKPILDHVAQQEYDEDVTFILESVWQWYAPYKDVYLSTITHRVDSPWYRIYHYLERNTPIAPKEIHDYFKNLKIKYDAVQEC